MRIVVVGAIVSAAVAALTGLTVSAPAEAAGVPTPDVVAVGTPSADGGAGAVDVHLPGGVTERLTPAGLGLPTVAASGFGSSVVSTDVNRDGRTDLVIGAAGGWPAKGPAGTGWIVEQGADGFSAAGVHALSHPAGSGDGFGHALAVSPRFDPTGTDVGSDLWVGAPGTTVAGHHDAGALYRYRISPTSAVSAAEKITQDSPLVPGTAETGDRYGEVLAAGNASGVLVGVPHEAIGSRKAAGAVHRLFTDRITQDLRKVVSVSQDTAYVPGVAEAGDEFGAAVVEGMVGVPGEDVGSIRDAGAVQLLTIADTYVGSDGTITQDFHGVPGHTETGDRFGAPIVLGRFTCYEEPSVAIGAPGESVGGARHAGIVIVMPRGENGCNTVSLVQGGALPGKPESGDRTGAALGTVYSPPATDGSEVYDTLLVGVPGETVSGSPGSGRVISSQLPHEVLPPVPPAVYTSFGPISGDEAAFGTVLGVANPG